VDACLLIIGVNDRSAPAAVRERFWIPQIRRYEALVELQHADGIEEVLVLATRSRTEFILWTSDPGAAGNSVLTFLTQHYGLRMREWQSFYRKLDEAAMLHVFRLAGGLDSAVIGDPEAAAALNQAWQQARKVAAVRRHLSAVLEAALPVAAVIREIVASDLSARSWEAHVDEAVERGALHRKLAIAAAHDVAAREARSFRAKLLAEIDVPAAALWRKRLEELGRQEIAALRDKAGKLQPAEEAMLQELNARLTGRIMDTISAELKQTSQRQTDPSATAPGSTTRPLRTMAAGSQK
jgi:glutamyl-tRNA reductase